MTHRTTADYFAGIPQYPGHISPADLAAAKAAAWDAGFSRGFYKGRISPMGFGAAKAEVVNPYRTSNVEGTNQ